MRLVSFARGVGVMVDDLHFVDLSRHAPELPRTLRGLLESDRLEDARQAARGVEPDGRIDDVDLLPVIPDPSAIWCVGVNYDDHRKETGRDPSGYPTLFLRTAASQVAHRHALVRPHVSSQLDYEGELAVIIGRGGRHIPEAASIDHIAGYACYNDGTIRDWQRHTSQFGLGKNFERTGAFGPWMTTRDELSDPYTQTLVTRLNGMEVQRARIGDMIFKIEQLIHYISTAYPLRPGDVISTGTPGGVGSKRTPPLFLRPGDHVEVAISGVGILENPVADER